VNQLPSIPMGEIRATNGEGTLRTLLGSCLGVSLWDRISRVGALAHIVLPKSNGSRTQLGKFADTAIPEMVRMIAEITKREAPRLQAKIAGGANMFATTGVATVGEQNILAVETILADMKIPIMGRHLGGEQGRRMLLDVSTGVVTVEIVGMDPTTL
jgi:chemotaxis protein CheD